MGNNAPLNVFIGIGAPPPTKSPGRDANVASGHHDVADLFGVVKNLDLAANVG
jgi:hypothetical protein